MSVVVTGEVKNILGTVLGLFVFGDVVVTPALLFGLILSSIGSGMYSFIKLLQVNSIKCDQTHKEKSESDGKYSN